MRINKSLLTNLLALLLVAGSYVLGEPLRPYLFNTGLFALSGGLTNWLAVYMLFERVPGFYGSGVIPLRFEEFKHAIRNLIMEQFFNRRSLDRFFKDATEISDRLEIELKASVRKLDLDSVFESLVDAVLRSSLGGMLGMLGGRNALESLRDPFKEKLEDYFQVLFDKASFRHHLQDAVKNSVESEAVLGKLEAMIDSRLEEMTPQLVKQIVQDMIREHLGWLVVWGCVVGGLIGLAFSVLVTV
ncbi:MAG: DUF445 family protein [Pseudomonadales bacterium]|nr:DUF445 family protein [Pseudomonadales bacterium]